MKIKLILAFWVVAVVIFAQNIKKEKVETSYLTYPKIPIKGMNMSNLSVEFAHSKPIIGDLKMVKGANLCKPKGGSIKDAKAIETYYYKVNYKSAEGIIRISDANGKILYVSYTDRPEDAVDEFAKDQCYFLPTILENAYAKQKDQYLANLTAQETNELISKAQEFTNKSLTFSYTPYTVEIHYVKSKKDYDYSRIEKASQLAVEAYSRIKENYNSESGKVKITQAIELWEKDLSEANVNDKKARIDKKVAAILYENLAVAYLFMQDFEIALDHINACLDLYPNITTNATLKRESIKGHILEQKKYHDMNQDVEISFSDHKPELQVVGTDGIDQFRADLEAFAGDEMKKEIVAKKEAYDKGVESGTINPFEAQVQHTATQGYTLVLPSLTGNITSLDDMKAAMKKLDVFPVEICELTQLNQLILMNNNIKEIPSDIKKLVNLTKLNVSKNKITVLPVELGELKQLKTLIVKGNPISQSEIDKIQKLLPDCKIKN